MPIHYEIAPERKLIRTRCVGDTRYAEVLEHFRKLAAEPALPQPLNVLLDLSKLESLPESDQLRTVAGEVEALAGPVRWGAIAIVAESDLLFGMARMFGILAEGHFRQTGVFRSLAEAEAWLAPQLGSG